MKFTPKVALLLVGLVGVPVGYLAWKLNDEVETATRKQENANQNAVAHALIGSIEQHIGRYLDDVVTIAVTMSYLAGDRSDAAMEALKSVVASREVVAFVRLEVPSSKIDTILGKSENDGSFAPHTTDDLRRRADEDGIAFALVDDKYGAITVRVPDPPGQRAPGAPTYLTAPVFLAPLDADLGAAVKAGEMEDANVALFDATRQVVSSYGDWGLARGSRPEESLFLRIIPDGIPISEATTTLSHAMFEGEEYIVRVSHYRTRNADSSGTADLKTQFGFAIGIARTERIAFQRVTAKRNQMLLVAGGVLLASIVAAILFSRSVTRPVLRLRTLAERIAKRDYDAVVPGPARSDEIGELDRGMVKMAHDLRDQEETIRIEVARRADLSRFMDAELVGRIVRGEQSLELGGKRMMVTVLFADVVAFTPFAESRPAEQVVGLLNELFTILSEVVFRHHGLVDKFIGDCIMAVFGAPVPQEDHAERALLAAEDMMRFLESVSETWREKYDVEVRLGIGIHSGEAIVGNVGSEKRMEYTVVGDVANVASRLETIARPNQILLSEETKKMTERRFPLKILGPQKLTGRKSEVTVYELEVG